MKLLKITDPAFKKYGRVIDNIDFSELTEALKKTPVPNPLPGNSSGLQLRVISLLFYLPECGGRRIRQGSLILRIPHEFREKLKIILEERAREDEIEELEKK